MGATSDARRRRRRAAAVLIAALAGGCGSRAAGGAAGAAACPATGQRPRVADMAECCASLSSGSVPRFFPNYTRPCPAERIATIMRDELNPALTSIADALFHGADADPDVRARRVADAAAVILGCAEKLDRGRVPSLPEGEWAIFDHMLIQLVINAHALQTAALEDDEATVVHWYHHVKQSCAACHSRFHEM